MDKGDDYKLVQLLLKLSLQNPTIGQEDDPSE